jgi:hypothetical protein
MRKVDFCIHQLLADITLIVSRLSRIHDVCLNDSELKENIITTLEEAKGLYQMIYPYASMLDSNESISPDIKLIIHDIVNGGANWVKHVQNNFHVYFYKKKLIAA